MKDHACIGGRVVCTKQSWLPDEGVVGYVAIGAACVMIVAFVVMIATMPPRAGAAVSEEAARADVVHKLANSDAVLYGASWCGYTQQQLRDLDMSEQSTRGVKYLACDGADRDVCNADGVDAFPSWRIAGRVHAGYRDVAELHGLISGR